MNEIKNKNVFIRVSENEKISLNATLKSAGFPYRNISVSVLWDICRELFCLRYSSLLMTNWIYFRTMKLSMPCRPTVVLDGVGSIAQMADGQK